MSKLKAGDKVPNFTLPDQDSVPFNMYDHLGSQNFVIYFYPKDETPGCTAEACGFRDQYQDFIEHNCEVIGISSDSIDSHNAFSRRLGLKFKLLSDEKGLVRKLFGVPNDLLGLLPGRVTYVVDKKGIIRYVFNSQIRPARHISEALRILNEINKI